LAFFFLSLAKVVPFFGSAKRSGRSFLLVLIDVSPFFGSTFHCRPHPVFVMHAHLPLQYKRCPFNKQPITDLTTTCAYDGSDCPGICCEDEPVPDSPANCQVRQNGIPSALIEALNCLF
jgi:hypothetical protein